MSAEDQPQRPRNRACPRWIPRRPLRPTRCGGCSAHTAALRGNARGARGFCRCSGRQPRPRKIVAAVLLFVPEGHRRKLAGGKPAPAGAAPGGNPTSHAPAGHRRRFLARSFRSGSISTCWRGQIESPVRDQQPRLFLRCPAGAPNYSRRVPGAASADADLPPANLLRCPSGTATARRRFETGTRRCGSSVPNSVGCAFAARCSSFLCGRLLAFDRTVKAHEKVALPTSRAGLRAGGSNASGGVVSQRHAAG